MVGALPQMTENPLSYYHKALGKNSTGPLKNIFDVLHHTVGQDYLAKPPTDRFNGICSSIIGRSNDQILPTPRYLHKLMLGFSWYTALVYLPRMQGGGEGTWISQML